MVVECYSCFPNGVLIIFNYTGHLNNEHVHNGFSGSTNWKWPQIWLLACQPEALGQGMAIRVGSARREIRKLKFWPFWFHNGLILMSDGLVKLESKSPKTQLHTIWAYLLLIQIASEYQGWDSSKLKLYFLRKTLLEEKAAILELGESQPRLFCPVFSSYLLTWISDRAVNYSDEIWTTTTSEYRTSSCIVQSIHSILDWFISR